MSAIALGTVQFGLRYGIANRQGQVSLDEARAILRRAKAAGVDTLDTAIAYGDSEQRLGEIGIQNWQVVSKLPAVPDDCTDISAWVARSLRQSLGRLKVQSLYGLLLHRPPLLLGPRGDELYQALVQLKDAGMVRRIGISIYDPSELDLLRGHPHLDLVQAPFNLLDRRLIDAGWLARFLERDIELHVRSVFLQGLLLMSAGDRPKQFDRWNPLWSDLERWLRQAGLTAVQACLRYALSFPEITRVVIGVDSAIQLEDVLRAAPGPAPAVPGSLQTNDLDLLNPDRWAAP